MKGYYLKSPYLQLWPDHLCPQSGLQPVQNINGCLASKLCILPHPNNDYLKCLLIKQTESFQVFKFGREPEKLRKNSGKTIEEHLGMNKIKNIKIRARVTSGGGRGPWLGQDELKK